MVTKSPKDRVVGPPNGHFMAYKLGLLTTYKSLSRRISEPSSVCLSRWVPWFLFPNILGVEKNISFIPCAYKAGGV